MYVQRVQPVHAYCAHLLRLTSPVPHPTHCWRAFISSSHKQVGPLYDEVCSLIGLPISDFEVSHHFEASLIHAINL